MATPADVLPAAPRTRIRWLQRLAVAAALGAVALLLALIWELLPARLDPNRAAPASISAAAVPRDTTAGDACARRLIDAWLRLSPTQRRSDLDLQPLSADALHCSATQPGLVESHLLRLDDGHPERYLHGETEDFATPDYLAQVRTLLARGTPATLAAPVGPFTDRLHAVPDSRPALVLVQRYVMATMPSTVPDAVPAAVRQVQVLLSVLAVGLVGMVGASLRWLSRSQRDYQRTLRSEIAFREDIEESIGVGLRVVNRTGQLTYVNRAFCETSGWPREVLIGVAPPYPFWPQDQTDRLDEHLHVILAGQARPDGYRVPFVRPDGTRWTAQVSARALGSGEGWILASTDITRELDDQRRIEAMNDELRRQSSVYLLGERSGELLHKISNHCGACLNALDGVHKHLQAGRHELLGEGVRIAGRAAQHMRDIVERFRPWLRDEAAAEPASLRETVADALAQESSYAAAQNVVMHNGVSAELPPVTLDRLALCEVLSNLLRNAIWAMEDTPLTNRQLSVESYVDEDAGQVQIHVRDRGRGVPVGLREKVFERGYSTRSGGSGWGLYICRHWIEKLGGRLAVTDNLPRGADFVITLPLMPPAPPEDSTDAHAQPQPLT
ncbi:MAG: PAS domain S-box protein [Sphaerotilus sp.]|nr:PAS domain S-box protein [Sphaerotilus sp.]